MCKRLGKLSRQCNLAVLRGVTCVRMKKGWANLSINSVNLGYLFFALQFMAHAQNVMFPLYRLDSSSWRGSEAVAESSRKINFSECVFPSSREYCFVHGGFAWIMEKESSNDFVILRTEIQSEVGWPRFLMRNSRSSVKLKFDQDRRGPVSSDKAEDAM